MIRINLISEGKKAPTVRSARLRAFNINAQNIAVFCVVAAFVLSVLGYGGYWLYMNRQLKSQQNEITELKATVAELEEIIKEVERFEKRKVELQHKIDVITDLRNNQRGPVHIMDQVSRSLPDFLWLDRLEMNASAGEHPGQGVHHQLGRQLHREPRQRAGVPGAGAQEHDLEGPGLRLPDLLQLHTGAGGSDAGRRPGPRRGAHAGGRRPGSRRQLSGAGEQTWRSRLDWKASRGG